MAKRSSTDYIVVHCAWTPPDLDIGAAEIDEWHRQRGWSGIGYHFVIRRDGTLEQGRPIDQSGAHVQGYNNRSVGICMVGGKGAHGGDECNYTPAQYARLRELIDRMQRRYPDAEVCGHRDFPGVTKSCPVFDVGKWLSEYSAQEKIPGHRRFIPTNKDRVGGGVGVVTLLLIQWFEDLTGYRLDVTQATLMLFAIMFIAVYLTPPSIIDLVRRGRVKIRRAASRFGMFDMSRRGNYPGADMLDTEGFAGTEFGK